MVRMEQHGSDSNLYIHHDGTQEFARELFGHRSAFSTQKLSTYSFANSWILDSGSNIHICNSKESFTSLIYYNDSDEIPTIGVGNTTIATRGYGTVILLVRGKSGTETIKLLNVAYIPGFHINLVS
jgi:hypothetical protein